MKKAKYMKPAMRVVEIQHRTSLLQASQPKKLTTPDESTDPEDWYELG